MAYQAQQLVALAMQVCNLPLGRQSQVGQMLNIILANHAQTIDEDVIRKTITLVVQPNAVVPTFYPLPSDYLRFYDVFYLIDGQPQFLDQMELSDFDKQYTGSGVASFPDRFATDVSQNPQPTAGSSPSIGFYPPSSQQISVTVRYRPQTSDIAAPETSTVIPWFPNQLVLLEELCEKAMWLSDDARSESFRKNVKEDLVRYLSISDDKEGYAQRVKLDPNTWRPRTNFPPSKKTGF